MFTVRYVWYEGHERGSRVPRDWSRVSSSLPLTTGCFLWILLWYGVARRPSPFHGVPSRRTDHIRSVSIPLRIKSNPPPPSLLPVLLFLLGVLDPRARHVQARKSSSRNVARRFNRLRIFVQSLLHVFGSCMYVDDRDLKGCLKRGVARIELWREKESVCIECLQYSFLDFSRNLSGKFVNWWWCLKINKLYIDDKKEKEDRRRNFKVRSNSIKIHHLLDWKKITLRYND